MPYGPDLGNAASDMDTRHEEHHYTGTGITLTTAYQDAINVTFTPPAGWTTYKLEVAGRAFFVDGTANVHTARVVIDGVEVGLDDHGTSDAFKLLMPTGSSSGLSGAVNVELEVKCGAASGRVPSAQLSIHARRLT